MMRTWILGLSLLLFALSVQSMALGQSSLNAGGGSAVSAFEYSYSLGQVFTEFSNNTIGSSSQGVQQVFQLELVTDINPERQVLQLDVSPNPVAETLNVSFKEAQWTSLEYTLLDIRGSIIETGVINDVETSINCSSLTAGTFIVKIYNEASGAIYTFRLIKS